MNPKIELLKTVRSIIEEKAKQKIEIKQGVTAKNKKGKRIISESFDRKKLPQLDKILESAKIKFEETKSDFNDNTFDDSIKLRIFHLKKITTKITDDNLYRIHQSKTGSHLVLGKKEKSIMHQNTYDLINLIRDLKNNLVLWDSKKLLIELLSDLMFWEWLDNQEGENATIKNNEVKEILRANGKKFSLPNIARYYRISKQVNLSILEEAKKIALKFGHTSGKKLQNYFNNYEFTSQRTAVNTESKTGFKNKVKDYEEVRELGEKLGNKKIKESIESEYDTVSKQYNNHHNN